jgi:hypothetical protein
MVFPLFSLFFPEIYSERPLVFGRNPRPLTISRAKEQRRSEENKYIAAQIRRISRKPVRATGDQSSLRRQRDHPHSLLIEVECRPYSQQKSDNQKQRARHFLDYRPESG